MKPALLFLTILTTAVCTIPLRAHEFQYSALLTGSNEAPPNASLATGSVLLTTDLDLVTLRIEANFTNLTGNAAVGRVPHRLRRWKEPHRSRSSTAHELFFKRLRRIRRPDYAGRANGALKL